MVSLTVTALYIFEHSSTTKGGFLYTFLPTEESGSAAFFLRQAATQLRMQLPSPDQNSVDVFATQNPSVIVYSPTTTMPETTVPYSPITTAPIQTNPPALLPPIAPIILPPAPYKPLFNEPIPATLFNIFPFYIPENSHLYEYFYYVWYDLLPETVVWKVNAHLHLPFYSHIRINNNPNPLLVNPFYRLPYGFSPYYLVPVNNPYCTLRATPETVTAFKTFRESAIENGFNLTVRSAYRPAQQQARLFANQNFVDGVVARPYHSEHQTGRALDLSGPQGFLDAFAPSPTGIWVANNAHYYGFIIRYRADTTHITGFIHEPWHITYVGLNISMYMHSNDILSLEEFVARHPEASLNR